MKVSVIVPTYNRAHLIQRTLDSVLAQTYKNLEVIVVDDGSADNTRDLVRVHYGSSVRYFYQKNQGVSSARNYGIQQATGDLIAFLDSDDEWFSNKLERQVHIFLNDPEVGLVIADDEIMTPHGLKAKPEIRHWLRQNDVFLNLALKNFVPTSSVVVKKDAALRAGGFDETISCFEDYDLWLRLAERTKTVVLNEKLSRYHEHGGPSLYSTSKRISRIDCAIYVLEKLKKSSEPKLRPVMRELDRRLAEFYFDLGIAHYRESAWGAASEALHKSAGLYPPHWKAHLYGLLSGFKKGSQTSKQEMAAS